MSIANAGIPPSSSDHVSPPTRKAQSYRITELAISILALILFVGGIYLCVGYNSTSPMAVGGGLAIVSLALFAWIVYRVTHSPASKMKGWIDALEKKPDSELCSELSPEPDPSLVQKIAQYPDLLSRYTIKKSLAAALLKEFHPSVDREVVVRMMTLCKQMNGPALCGACRFPEILANFVNSDEYEGPVAYLFSKMTPDQQNTFLKHLDAGVITKYVDRFSYATSGEVGQSLFTS